MKSKIPSHLLCEQIGGRTGKTYRYDMHHQPSTTHVRDGIKRVCHNTHDTSTSRWGGGKGLRLADRSKTKLPSIMYNQLNAARMIRN